MKRNLLETFPERQRITGHIYPMHFEGNDDRPNNPMSSCHQGIHSTRGSNSGLLIVLSLLMLCVSYEEGFTFLIIIQKLHSFETSENTFKLL